MKRQIAVVLGVLVLIALLATSFVSARTLNAVMDSPFVTIPEGSTHPSYDGDYIPGDQTIDLQHQGWEVSLPPNVCAVAVRLSYKHNTPGEWAALRPSMTGAFGVVARVQVANLWVDDSGIVPLNSPNGNMRLDLSNAGFVYMEITGYWMCNDYIRPTPSL